MGTKKISELEAIASLQKEDLLPVVDTINNSTKKITTGNLTGSIAGINQYTTGQNYKVGDYCIYDDTLYICNTEISSSGDFDNLKWTITTIKNELYKVNTKASARAMSAESSAVTNTTTGGKYYGPTLSITTTGKPLIVIASTVSYVSGGNVDHYVVLDGVNGIRIGGHSNSAREETTGFAIYNGIAAGTHTIRLSFACSQSNKTATIPPYVFISIIAFEI